MRDKDCNSVCYLVGAADFREAPRVKDGDFVIAADGGYDRLNALGITPNALIGDMDSIEEVPSGIELFKFKAEKDETDMRLRRSHHQVSED